MMSSFLKPRTGNASAYMYMYDLGILPFDPLLYKSMPNLDRPLVKRA